MTGVTSAASSSATPTAAGPGFLHRRVRPSRIDRAGVAGIAAVSGVLAVLWSGAAPTTTAPVDAALCAMAVALVTVAASRARRWTLITALAVTGIAAGTMGVAVAAVALLVVAAMVERNRRNRVFGAAVGGVIGLLALHASLPGPAWVEPTVVLVGVTPVLWSAYRVSRRTTRRRWRVAVVVLTVAVGVSTLGAAALVSLAVSDVSAGADSARGGVSAAEDGELELATARFEEGNEQFRRAGRLVDNVFMFPARLVPGVGANVAAVQHGVRAGAELTDVAASLAQQDEFDAVLRVDGGVDLARLEEVGEPLRVASAALGNARDGLTAADSPWLLPPIEVRVDELAVEAAGAGDRGEAAAAAVEHLPGLLGADTPRRYLFLFGNPAEARDIGGHLGNWAEVIADDGSVELVEVGAALDLAQPRDADVGELDAGVSPLLMAMNPFWHPQNWGAHPDMGEVGPLAAAMFEARTGRPVDGVVYLDVVGLAAMLEIVGPVTTGGSGSPFELTRDNAVEFLTTGQYEVFDDDRDADEALTEVLREVFDRATTSRLPGPRPLAESFGPLVDQGRFRLWSAHDDDRPLIDEFALGGPRLDGQPGDVVSVVSRNAGPSKIDAYLRRDVDVSIDWAPGSGQVRSAVVVDVHNDAPAEGLSRTAIGNALGLPPGTNVMDLAVHTPHRLRSVLVDGIDTAAQPLLDGELWRHSVRVIVPPGSARRVAFHLEGEVDPGPDYRFHYVGQPLLNDDDVSVELVPVLDPANEGAELRRFATVRGGDGDGAGKFEEVSEWGVTDGQIVGTVRWRLESEQ